jgi:hypothetical protein
MSLYTVKNNTVNKRLQQHQKHQQLKAKTALKYPSSHLIASGKCPKLFKELRKSININSNCLPTESATECVKIKSIQNFA